MLPPPPLPLKIFAVIIIVLLLSSSPLDINRGGLLLFAEASRAYPHGCLYRHPSYYTYDERDDISWFNHQNNYDETFSAQLSTSTTIGAATATARSTTTASEFTDYRKLPPKNHPIRRTYQQYKLLRRLGAGKFSNVFEAVDVYMAAATVHAKYNNDYDDVIQKKQRRKKMVTSSSSAPEQNVDDALSNEATTTTDSSDNESTTSQSSSSSSSSSSTKPAIDPNTLVVLKCLKPISERKIRRELLVLTHCQNLPNLARLIGIVIPSSMDLEEENNDGGKGVVVDDKEGNDNFNEKRVNGGESRRHHQSVQHQSHNHRKRRRYSNRTSRQSQQKQQHNQQRRRQQHQDIGSITTDAHNLPEKDVNLANKKNANNGNNGGNKKNSSNSQQQHGEQIPALVLEHAGQRAQWFCHGPRPSSISSETNKTTQQSNMYRGRHSYQNHLTEYEMKYYLCHLLIALDGLHAAGIMHRDVKPRNTLINLNSEPVFAASSSSEERRKSSSSGMMGSCASSIVQSSTSTTSSSPSSQSRSSTTLPSPLPPPLMLVDLGLADFYLPGKEFNVRVASRHYKSPELLIGYEYYDYAIDMWSVGCILAGLLFRIEPFFRGVDNEDQLGQIVNCLGTRDFLPYCRKCNVRLSSKARAAIGKYCSESSSSSSSSSSEDSAAPISFSNSDIGRRKPWLSYLTPDCPIPSSEATDLLDKLLVYDHEQRWTAREALGHAFFDEVRDEVWNEVQERILWESQRRSLSSSPV